MRVDFQDIISQLILCLVNLLPLSFNSHTWKEVDLLFGFWSWREEQGLSTKYESFWILTVLLPIGDEWRVFHSNWCMRIISLGLSFCMKNVTIVPIRPETRLTDTCSKYKKVFLVIFTFIWLVFFQQWTRRKLDVREIFPFWGYAKIRLSLSHYCQKY